VAEQCRMNCFLQSAVQNHSFYLIIILFSALNSKNIKNSEKIYRCNLFILLRNSLTSSISSGKLGRKPCPVEIPVQFACSRPPFPQLSVFLNDGCRILLQLPVAPLSYRSPYQLLHYSLLSCECTSTLLWNACTTRA